MVTFMYGQEDTKFDPKTEWAGITSGTSFAIEWKDKEGKTSFSKYYLNACFGYLISGNPKWKDNPVNMHVYLLVRPELRDKIDRFYNYIFDPKKSPWASIIPAKGLYWESPSKSQTPYVTIPLTSKTPIQVLMSLCFACRMGQDIHTTIRRFNQLTDKGWTEAEAIFTGTYFGIKENGVDTANDPYRGHNPFNTDNIFDLNKFEKGKPNFNSDLTFGMGYKNVNAIWDKEKGQHRSAFDVITRGDNSYKGTFKKEFEATIGSLNFQNNTVFKTEDILKFKDEILNLGRK